MTVIAALALVALGAAAADVADDPLAGLFEQGLHEEVVDAAYLRLGEDPDDAAAHYWLGRASYERALALLETGRFGRDLGLALLDRAIEALERAPPGSDARAWRDRARRVRGDGDDPAFVRELETRAASGDADAAYVRALVARDAGRLDEAWSWLERAREAAPTPRVDVLLEATRVAAARGRADAALQAWRAAREAGADREALLLALAQVLPERRDAARRLALIETLDAPPADPTLCWYRGYALWELGRPEQAVAAMEAAGPGRTPAFTRAHARFLLAASRPEAAVARLRPLVEDGDIAALELLVSAADALALARRFEPALDAYALALDASPGHERALVNRALTLSQAGRPEQASASYEEVLARRPRRADLLNDAALHEWGRGRPERARALWGRAVALPGSVDAAENLAVSLRKIDPTRAVELLDEVLAAEPTRDRALYQRFLVQRGAR